MGHIVLLPDTSKYSAALILSYALSAPQVLVWQEVFQNTPTPLATLGSGAVVSVWKGADYATLTAVVKAGLRAVLSGPW